MSMEAITKEDLNQFKHDLLSELKNLLQHKPATKQKWLKTYQVCELLGICRNKLHQMRRNGTINGTKIGSLIFYSEDDITQLMNSKSYKNHYKS
jgi:hypothetical protein